MSMAARMPLDIALKALASGNADLRASLTVVSDRKPLPLGDKPSQRTHGTRCRSRASVTGADGLDDRDGGPNAAFDIEMGIIQK